MTPTKKPSKTNSDASLSQRPFWVNAERDYDKKMSASHLPTSAAWSCRFWLLDELSYDLEEERGRGAFGVVYQAKERTTGLLLAIKVFKINAEGDALDRRLENIKDEGRLLTYIRGGPHVIKTGDIRHMERGENTLSLELPMDYYKHTLSHLMQETQKEKGLIAVPPWYNTVLTQMLEALEFLHSKKVMVVHRDVTPENILYNKTDEFVLAGFSLARYGTPMTVEYGRKFEYLAPEVCESSEETTAVDIWAVGVLCLDMLCHMKPINDKHRSFDQMKQLDWCDCMCELARHVNKPEVKMMVVKRRVERSRAAEVLRFVRCNPSAQTEPRRPKRELLYLITKENRAFGCWSEEEISAAGPTHSDVDHAAARIKRSTSGPGTTRSSSLTSLISGRTGITRSESLTLTQPAPPPGPSSEGLRESAGPSGSTSKRPLPTQSPSSGGSEGRAGPSGWAAAPPLSSSGSVIDMAAARAMLSLLGPEAEGVPGLSAAVLAQMLGALQAEALPGSTSRQPQPPPGRPSADSRGGAAPSGSTTRPSATRTGERVDLLNENDSRAQKRRDEAEAKQPRRSSRSPPSHRSETLSQQGEAEARKLASSSLSKLKLRGLGAEPQAKESSVRSSHPSEAPSQQGKAKAERLGLPSHSPQGKTRDIKPRVTKSVASTPRPSESQPEQHKTEARQVSPPSAPQPQGGACSPPSSRRTVAQPKQGKAEVKQPSSSSAPQPQAKSSSSSSFRGKETSTRAVHGRG